MTSNKYMYIVNKIMGLKTKRYRPSKTSTSFLDQLSKILSFSTFKPRREIIKQKRR